MGDCRKMEYRIGPNFRSYARRGNRRLVDSVTVDATRKTDEKTTKMVFHLTEIALYEDEVLGRHQSAISFRHQPRTCSRDSTNWSSGMRAGCPCRALR